MKVIAIFSLLMIIIFSCSSSKQSTTDVYQYKIDNQQLYDTISRLDSIFFNYYNTCDRNLEAYANFYSDSLEFYHDKGGYQNSKTEIIASTKKFVCGKVTRQLIKSSIEVYPIPNYGAIEIGLHRFINSQEPDAKSLPGRFTIIWQYTASGWKIRKVISLH